MSGIVEVIVIFFLKGEERGIGRHQSRVPVDKDAHKGVSNVKKTCYGVFRTKGAGASISLNLFRPAKSPVGKCENFAIVTDGQWQLAPPPNLILDESSSEINGKCERLLVLRFNGV